MRKKLENKKSENKQWILCNGVEKIIEMSLYEPHEKKFKSLEKEFDSLCRADKIVNEAFRKLMTSEWNESDEELRKMLEEETSF